MRAGACLRSDRDRRRRALGRILNAGCLHTECACCSAGSVETSGRYRAACCGPRHRRVRCIRYGCSELLRSVRKQSDACRRNIHRNRLGSGDRDCRRCALRCVLNACHFDGE